MEPERTGRRTTSLWSSRGQNAPRYVHDENAEDPFSEDVRPAFTRGDRGGSRSQRRSNAFSTASAFQAAPEDVFGSPRYEDPFAAARARNRSQVATSNPWQTGVAPVSVARNSFASHLFQGKHSGGANMSSASAPQDVFQVNAAEFASQEAPDFVAPSVGAGFPSPNNDASRPPKYPFKNVRGQQASSYGVPQTHKGLAPRKQVTAFGNAAGVDEAEEWPAQEEENASRSWRGNDVNRRNRVSQHTGERLSLFIRSVPVPLFSKRAMKEHFERLPVSVSNISLRGSKQKDANRTAVVTFESAREASLAFSGGRLYNGTVLNIQFYEPYEVRKNSRAKERDEQKRVEEVSLKLYIPNLPRGIRTSTQLKHILEGFADGVTDVQVTERHEPDGRRRDAIISMWDEETAEALLRSKPRYHGNELPISFVEDGQVHDDHTRTRHEQEKSAVRKASRKEAKQMTEQERLREMEKLRREIAKIEEKKRQQEARKEKQLSEKHKHARSPRETYERLPSNTDQRKVDARLSKYGSQKPYTELHKTRESTNGEHWRKVGKKMDIQDAKQFVGVCLDMCPLSEFESRVEQRDISPFELRSGPGSEPDSTKAVKKYRRSAAISEEQKPEEVRPPDVLARTMDHLKKVCDSKKAEFYEIHNFVRDRTRSIRQDFTLQGVRDECCIKIHEESVRFHIMSEHRLFGTNPAQFSSKQNLEQLDKCLISLREMYDLRREQNLGTSPNEPEMQAYYILTQMSDPQTCVQLWTGFAQDVRRSPPVRFALEVVKAAGGQFANPVKFFSCVRQAPYLTACLMHSRFTLLRVQALRLLNSAHGSTSSRDEIAIDTLTKRLCFEDEGEARQFCELLGFEVLSSVREESSQNVITPPSRDFDTSRVSLFKTRRADKVIESKAGQLSPSEIIDGAANRRFSSTLQESGNGFQARRSITHSDGWKIQEEEPIGPHLRLGSRLGINTPKKQESVLSVSNIEASASGINNQSLFSAEQHGAFGTRALAKGKGSSSSGPVHSQIDSGNHPHLVTVGAHGPKPGELTSLKNSAANPILPTALIKLDNVAASIHSKEKQRTTGSNLKAFREAFSLPGKAVLAATNTEVAPLVPSPGRNGNENARGGSESVSAKVDLFTSGKDQRAGKRPSIAEHRLSEPEQQRGNEQVSQSNETGIPGSGRIGVEREEDGQRRLRERASQLVEERQRIVAIAKKARETRHRERSDKVLNEFARYTNRIEESLGEAFAVLRSLKTGEMSRSDTLNASHAGFEHLDRAVARITRAEEFLEEAKRWSWEGQEFPQQPVPILSSFREKGRVAWEEMSACRKTALLQSPEPPEVDEHTKKFFFGNKKDVTDLRSPLDMSMKTVTDRIPILSIPCDELVPTPGLEVTNVLRTLKKLGVLQWQGVIVGENQGPCGANAITTSWLRSRLGNNGTENGMLINAKNEDVLKYPCLSVLRVDNDDELPITASTIIWSLDGSKGQSGLCEEQKIIEHRLSTLQAHSQTVPKVPPFLILVCFNSMGPLSPSVKEELEGDESEWALSLVTKDLVCGVRSVVLSRDTVLQRKQDFQLSKYLEESVVTYRSRVAAHGMDFELQRVSDKLVEVGNNAWMEVLDQQLSQGDRSTSNELCDVISLVNKNWYGVAKSVSDAARMWPTEFSRHRVHFVRVGAELIRRMRLPIPSESDEHSCSRYLRLLCTSAGIAFPKIYHDGFQGLVEFCRALGVIMPRLVASLLQDLNDVEAPLLRMRIVHEEVQTSRVRRLNVLFTLMFGRSGSGYSRDVEGRRRKDSSLGKRQRDRGDRGEEALYQGDLGSPMQKRRLSLNEEYRGVGETPNRRFSLPWKTFGSRRDSERYKLIVAEAEAIGEEINATIELLRKRRRVAEPERQLVVAS